MDDDRVRAFYDDLAGDYHLLFPDWDASMARQGAALDQLIRGHAGAGNHDVLDCACGIGTQAIALAGLGHRLIGSDLSAVATRRARTEAAARGLRIPTIVADMRHLPVPAATFDVAGRAYRHWQTHLRLASPCPVFGDPAYPTAREQTLGPALDRAFGCGRVHTSTPSEGATIGMRV